MIDRTSPEQVALQNTLKQVRQEAGFRQMDLANALGVSQSYIAKLELGECKLDLVQLREICNILGTNLDEFVRRFEGGIASNKES